MSPAGIDADPKPTGHDGTVEMATKTSGLDHPAVLSVDPPEASDDPLAVVTNDDGHQSVIFEVPVDGGEPIRFGVILVGKIEA